MALTQSEEKRIQAIEEMVNRLSSLLSTTASQAQLRQLLAIKQKEIDDLTVQVESLTSQVSILQDNLI